MGLSKAYSVLQAKLLLQSRIAQTLAAQLAAAGLSYQQLDAHLTALAEQLRGPLAAEFAHLGIELTDFRLTGTVFDAATQQRIGRVADVTAITQAAATVGLSYIELERLNALRDAARNASGLVGAGVQLGAVAELARQVVPTSTPSDPTEQLQKLKQLFNAGVITAEEFAAKKKAWLDKW